MLPRIGAGERKQTPRILAAFPGGRAAAHPIRGDENRTLAHAEHQQIRTAVYKDTRTNGIVPVVIMREAAQRGFNAGLWQSEYRHRLLESNGSRR